MKKLLIASTIFLSGICQAQTTIIVKISDDTLSGLERYASWDSNCENLKASYYEIQFGVSYQKNGNEILTKTFVYRTDPKENTNSKRNVMNFDGSWHTCLDESDPRWDDGVPEFIFWFNLVNKTNKAVSDEDFKKTIISNLDEQGYFNK